jgi:hypothetical protein
MSDVDGLAPLVVIAPFNSKHTAQAASSSSTIEQGPGMPGRVAARGVRAAGTFARMRFLLQV